MPQWYKIVNKRRKGSRGSDWQERSSVNFGSVCARDIPFKGTPEDGFGAKRPVKSGLQKRPG